MTSIREEMISQTAGSIAAKKDAAIREVLNSLWHEWTLSDVKARCKIVRMEGSPVETLYVDDVPTMEFHPIESELVQTETGWTYRVTQKYRDLRQS